MRDEQAEQSDQHSADADDAELDPLPHQLRSAVLAEGPVPVPDPVHDDRQNGRDDLGEDRTLVNVIGVEDRRAQDVEDAEVDNQTEAPDQTEADELHDELAHRGGPPRFQDNG